MAAKVTPGVERRGGLRAQTFLADSIVFQNVTMSYAVRSRIKKIITSDSSKNLYPTQMDLATLAHEPERSLRAIQAQQASAQAAEEGSFTSNIAKRIASIGDALGIDTDSPAGVSNMVTMCIQYLFIYIYISI